MNKIDPDYLQCYSLWIYTHNWMSERMMCMCVCVCVCVRVGVCICVWYLLPHLESIIIALRQNNLVLSSSTIAILQVYNLLRQYLIKSSYYQILHLTSWCPIHIAFLYIYFKILKPVSHYSVKISNWKVEAFK